MKTLWSIPRDLLLCAAAMGLVGCPKAEVVKPSEPLTQQAVQAAKPPPEESAEEHEWAGFTAFKNKEYATAKERFGKALAKNPKLLLASYNKAFIDQQEGNLDGAARGYEAVLALEPEHEGALLNLGKVYRDQNQPEKGIALYEAAVAKRPFDVKLLTNLTVFYRLAKKHDKATATVRKLLSRTKDNPDAYKNLALIAHDQGQLRLAEFIGANAKKLDKEDPAVYNNLGLVYLKLGEPRRALANFKIAVDKRKDFAPGHANIGAMALSYRDYETAAKSFENVVKLEPGNWTAYLNLAWSYEGSRQKDGNHRSKDAVAAFEKVLTIVKDHPDAVYGIARAYAGELKDLPKAKEYYDRYLALSDAPSRDKAQKELASLELRIKAGAEAERMKAEAEAKAKLLEDEKKKKVQEQLSKGGSMLEQVTKKEEEAAPEAPKDGATPAPSDGTGVPSGEKTASPSDAPGYVTLARAKIDGGDSAAARSAVDAALKLDPNNVDAKELLKKLDGAAAAPGKGNDPSAEAPKP